MTRTTLRRSACLLGALCLLSLCVLPTLATAAARRARLDLNTASRGELIAGSGIQVEPGASGGGRGQGGQHAQREEAKRAEQARRPAKRGPGHGRPLPRDLQDLAGKDLVGVLELVTVGLEDPVVLVGVAVVLLADLRK